MGLVDERKYYGEWWEPSQPDKKQSGVLTIASDGDTQLELVGGFDLTLRTPIGTGGFAVHAGSRELPVLHGTCERTDITLLNCLSVFSRGAFFDGGPSFQRLLANRAVVGFHLENQVDETFRGATIRLENFTTWVSLPTVAHTLGFKDDVSEAQVRLVDPLSVTVDGWEYQARPSLHGFSMKRHRESDSVVGDATTELRIVPPEPADLTSFDRIVTEFTDLLTLGTGRPCGLISMVLDLPEDDVTPLGDGRDYRRPKTAEVVGQRIHTADATAPAIEPHRLLFSCADLPFELTVPAWLALRRMAPSACNILFGLKYARPSYTEMRLLSLAIAAESLHHSLFGDVTDMPQAHFNLIRDAMLSALTSEDDRKWAKEKFRNQPSFRERAKALAAVPAPDAVAHVVPDIDRWASDLLQARNGLAHAAGDGLGSGVFTLAERTWGMLSLVLMARVGLSPEVQLRAAQYVLRVFDQD